MARKQRPPTEQIECTLAEWDALYLDEAFHAGPYSVRHEGAWYAVWVDGGRCVQIYDHQTREQVCKGLRTPSFERLRGYYEQALKGGQ